MAGFQTPAAPRRSTVLRPTTGCMIRSQPDRQLAPYVTGMGPTDGATAPPEGANVGLYEAAGRVKSWCVSPCVGFT